MRNKFFAITLALALLLVACQGAAPTDTPEQPAEVAATEKPAEPEATDKPAQAPAQTSQSKPASNEPMPGCRVKGLDQEVNPTLQALFPAVSDQDWVKGPSDAAVTIIEYSDFQ